MNDVAEIEKITDSEMRAHLLSLLFQVGDSVLKDGVQGKIAAFPHHFHGRLTGAPCKWGKYRDRQNPLVSFVNSSGRWAELKKCSILGLEFADVDLLKQRFDDLPEDWYYIDLEKDYLEPLPETKFIESDIVKVTDKNHEHYSDNPDENQFTVYRIDHLSEDKKYKLRSGSLLFDITEDKIQSVAHGPIRIYEGGQPLVWRDLQSEAEFHLLIGNFKKSYNPINQSYNWSYKQARQVIDLGTAHGIQKVGQNYNLITFLDEKVGREVATSHLILTI